METTKETLPTVQNSNELSIIIKQIPALSELRTKLENAHNKAAEKLDAIQVINDDEDYEDVMSLLGRTKKMYDTMVELRTPITKQTDDIKDWLMEYERPFNPADKKVNKYHRVRQIAEAYQQTKLEKQQELAREVAKKKEKENSIVDIKATIKQNLLDMVTMLTKKAESGASGFFADTTLETYEERAKTFAGFSGKLPQKAYDECFNVKVTTSLLTDDELNQLTEDIKTVEPFTKWNEEVKKAVNPVLNAWRAKLPELKEQLVALANTKDEESRNKLAAEQKAKSEAETKAKQEQLDKEAEKAKSEISIQASADKMSNDFAAQATLQQSEDTGKTRQVMKFNDLTKPETAKAFIQIIYHCMASPKFPGFQKRDKTKKLVVDSKGRPEYIDAVDFWVNFFMENCDGAIDGTTIFEDSKITVRK